MQYIYFTADWCGPCKAVKPRVIESGKPIQIVNIDVNKEMSEKYNIRSIPTILGVNGDQVVERYTGAPQILTFLGK